MSSIVGYRTPEGDFPVAAAADVGAPAFSVSEKAVNAQTAASAKIKYRFITFSRRE
jgi:hypothetical protein